MSDNMYTTPYQPSTNQSYSRPRLNPDPGHDIPSTRENQFSPLVRDLTPIQSSLPPFPAASFSHGDLLRQMHLNSPVPQPSSSNLEVRRSSSSNTRDALLSYSKLSRSSSDNQSLKRDLDSAFGGGSSLGPSLEIAMGAQTGWFPEISNDDRRRFLLEHSSDEFERQCRTHALRAKWSYDAMIDNENRAKKAEEEAYVLRSQLGQLQAILEEEKRSKEKFQASFKEERKLRKEAAQRATQVCGEFGAIRATLDEERRTKEKFQASLEEERRLRMEADQRVKELEETLVAADQEKAQGQGLPGMEPSVKVNTGLEANVDESQDNLHWILEPPAVEREGEQEEGLDSVEPLVNASTGLNANTDEHQENFHLLGDRLLKPPAVEREQEQARAGMELSENVNLGSVDHVDHASREELQMQVDTFWTVLDIAANAWDKPNE